ncbi:hypothetical protein PVAP13_2NG052800 [Panicum virgatum]|uniref:Uncharacterized protein n=1 Tax=Panicum virgatum TaxID=38727 RepID=A0A8T0V5I6_PANVG|nr:hypothetical protein PVAP13_2NG052800 [Panicum virgatum]
MVDELRRKEAALALLVSQLQQLRWERGEGASRFRGSEPRQEHAGAAGLQMLEREMGTMHESLNTSRDRMLALRLQEEEVQAYRESLKAREEFWKPVPVHQRKNSKISGICNWERLVSVIAFANGLVLFFQIRALLPVNQLIHVISAIVACWMLGSIAFCCRLLGASSRSTKGFSLHFAGSMCVSLLLLVLCVLYLCLIWQFIGLISKHA